MGETKAQRRERAHRYYLANREKINERNKQYARNNREGTRERDRRYRESHLDVIRQRKARYRAANLEAVKERAQRYRAAQRAAVFGYYGWACACCCSTENLTIDHIGGDGGQHREELFGRRDGGIAGKFYNWLRDNGFPDGFQTLCRPCNSSKRDRPRCQLDHQEAV